ncbi:MAG: IS21 family transposase [Crocinitomicaceae bacterium]|nr:IS21 family transposase [Crocinitomicaceae bacterium]
MGKKKIGLRLGVSKNTVKQYVERYKRLKIPWEELCKLSDFELNKLFHPPQQVPLDERLKQLHDYFPEMEKQMRKRGMTVLRQFEAYQALHPEGVRQTTFYFYYNRWCKKVNPTMHIEHKVADKMYVDFAGATLPYVDEHTGEIKQAQVFVAILGWSQYAYVEAMQNQTIEEFIAACENALHYFKGVPLAIVPDNLKSAVFKANKYEPMLNENFKSFADHYAVAILPARSRKPQDKALVEGMVKLSYQRIYTKIQEKPPLTLRMQPYPNIWLEHNNAPFIEKTAYEPSNGSEEWNKPALEPCRKTYEMRKIRVKRDEKRTRLPGPDEHYYSVPYSN